jgi:hypothetical protein
MNKTALVDAEHLLDAYRAQQVGTVVCVRSFACQDEDTGEVFVFSAGNTYINADHDVVRAFPENFGPSDRDAEGTDDVELRSESSSEPDVRGLLVCCHAFSFVDPDSGYERFVRYGHDYVEPDDWLREHYPECFLRVEEVVPSDGIPNLPLRDDDE